MTYILPARKNILSVGSRPGFGVSDGVWAAQPDKCWSTQPDVGVPSWCPPRLSGWLAGASRCLVRRVEGEEGGVMSCEVLWVGFSGDFFFQLEFCFEGLKKIGRKM